MKLNFSGDVFLDKTHKVDSALNNFIFNLECPLSTSGIPAKDKVNLGSDVPNILETFGKFLKAVNLANNHIMDYGEEAFGKMTEYLEKKIAYFGAGNEENNYNNPCSFDHEVPAIYDGTKFLRRFVRAQYKLNTQIIVVGLDSALNISYDTFVFKNGVVKKEKVEIPRWIPAFQKYYKLYKKLWFKKMMVEVFLRNPRVPKYSTG